MTDDVKGMTINTIDMPKLTTVINDFICQTANHLNKLCVYVEDKFEEYDKKMEDLEIMTTLLEAKLK